MITISFMTPRALGFTLKAELSDTWQDEKTINTK
jgi:hypothetical protein